MTTYQPNFKDPRTSKRIKQALGFSRGCFSNTKSHRWSTRYIDRYLGRNDTNLGNWLRKHLLIVTNERYRKEDKICKEYILNQQGHTYVKEMFAGIKYQNFTEWISSEELRYNVAMSDLLVDESNNYGSLTTSVSYPSVQQVGDQPLILDWIKHEFGKELKDLDFTYEDKSDRLWHPLQRVKRAYKKIVFSEYNLKHQYDIECCALTLLHQYSQQIPEVITDKKYIQGPMDLYLPAIRSYLENRTTIRNQIAHDAQIPAEVVKVIINALIAGAQLSNSPRTDIYQLLKGDTARIEFLKQHPFIVEFRSNLKIMWDYIKPTLQKRTIQLRSGVVRNCPISSKQKWNLYFNLERRVLNQVTTYLKQTNNKYFLEHDGWSARDKIDEVSLVSYVYEKTGFKISLDMALLTTSVSYPSVQQVGVLLN